MDRMKSTGKIFPQMNGEPYAYDPPVRLSLRQESNVTRSNIPKRYEKVTMDFIKQKGVPSNLAAQVAVVDNYIAHIDDRIRHGNGLLFRGPVGTMKTSLAIAVMRAAIDRGWRAYFIPMANLVDDIFSLQGEERIRFQNRLDTTDLLVIDDLGMEFDKEDSWVKAKIRAIVNNRYNDVKSTIVTTNLGADIQNRYVAGMLDRIRSTSEFVNFSGKSLRERE